MLIELREATASERTKFIVAVIDALKGEFSFCQRDDYVFEVTEKETKL